MSRVWLSGIAISLVAHLAVAAVLLLALDLQPAGQQPQTGTRLNVSAVGVPHIRAVPRPLPAVALPGLTAQGARVPLAAIQRRPASQQAPTARAAITRGTAGLSLAVLRQPGAPVTARRPGAERTIIAAPLAKPRRAAAPPAKARAAAAPRGAAHGARIPTARRTAALAVSAPLLAARPFPAVLAPAWPPDGLALAARPAAGASAAKAALPWTAIRADALVSRALEAGPPSGEAVGAVTPVVGTRLAMAPTGILSDARPLLPVDLPARTSMGQQADAVPPGGGALPLAPRAAASENLAAESLPHVPAVSPRLAPLSASAPAPRVVAVPQRTLRSRTARQLKDMALLSTGATPRVAARPADDLWSGDGAPDPVSLAALAALTGGTGADARAVRTGIERALAGQPCSRVQARLDQAGPRLTLRGHVPDLRTAGALMAALRGPLGEDIQLSADLATLPRPLCADVAQLAAIGLAPMDAPGDALGQAVQSRAAPGEGGAPVLRLPAGGGGFVHVDLYQADGTVTHLRPPPGTLPAHRTPGAGIRIDLTERAGPGPAVLAFLVTSRPLYLWPRPRREPADVYLRFLANQAEAMRQAAGLAGRWRYAILPPLPASE